MNLVAFSGAGPARPREPRQASPLPPPRPPSMPLHARASGRSDSVGREMEHDRLIGRTHAAEHWIVPHDLEKVPPIWTRYSAFSPRKVGTILPGMPAPVSAGQARSPRGGPPNGWPPGHDSDGLAGEPQPGWYLHLECRPPLPTGSARRADSSADELGHELGGGAAVQGSAVHLHDLTLVHHAIRSEMAMASSWSWVT
jgi:hypothetical protein